MHALLLGIDRLSFQAISECEMKNLIYLSETAERGVVESPPPLEPCRSWARVLGSEDPLSSPLVERSGAKVVNVPSKGQTVGLCASEQLESRNPKEELTCVKATVLDLLPRFPVVAAITFARKPRCEDLKMLDEAVGDMVSAAEDFILFSACGQPLEDLPEEPYGIYLSTARRPRKRDTVKPEEIGHIFLRMVED